MPLREVFILGRLGYYFVIKIDCRACGEAREGYMGGLVRVRMLLLGAGRIVLVLKSRAY